MSVAQLWVKIVTQCAVAERRICACVRPKSGETHLFVFSSPHGSKTVFKCCIEHVPTA